jgi:protein-S-isoprenylcysteine O-methyltransferase Ste14
MYLGFCAGWVGLWVVFGRASLPAIVMACLAALATILFVLLYEEPKLGKMFGEEYAEYRKNVRRWIPRMHAWNK